MEEKILSISIAAFNAEKDLKKCLESFIKCKYLNNLELIIVNDGSKDTTLNIANYYKANYPNSINVIDKENGGHGSTINASIKAATGKYYKIVDSDDWVESDNLDKLIERLKQSDADLIYNPYNCVNTNGEFIRTIDLKSNLNIEYGKKYPFDDSCTGFRLSMHAMTIKTSIIKEVGPIIDEKCFYVDAEYTIFPIKHINSVIFLDYIIYDYLIGSSTQSMNFNNLINRRDQHLRVCKRIISYYSSLDIDSNFKKTVIKNRIMELVITQYSLYFHIEPNLSHNEIREYDSWIKNNCIEIYEYLKKYPKNSDLRFIKKFFIKLILLMRKNNFKIYPIILKTYQFFQRKK